MPSEATIEPVPTPTPTLLVAAAMAEFNERGFAGTDTNRIARRAGFAPQTFYRWFRDKTEIFIAAYRAWWEEEETVLTPLMAQGAPDEVLVEAGIAHHRRYLMFRRSLRQLSLEDEAIRAARAERRLHQVDQLRAWTHRPDAATDDLAVQFFKLERLTDAVAEGELADMGLTDDAARAELARIIATVRG
jgi:AcrR family transcriptional regulator